MRKRVAMVLCFILIFSIVSGVYSNVNSLDGKTIAFLGDSIMAGYGNEDRAFDYYLKNYIEDATLINNSKSGSTVTENTGNDEIVIINQVKSLEGNPDLIVLNGGVNDIIGYALGFLDNSKKLEIGLIDPDTKEISDKNTVLGNMENIFIEIKNRFPEARICYSSILLIDDEMISNITIDESKKPDIRKRRDEYFTQMPILCEKYGAYYVDLTHLFVDHNEQYRQPDWIHMTETGYAKVTPFLYQQLNKIKFSIY